MADPLEGGRAKIERAKEHLIDLNAEIATFSDLRPYGVTSYADLETGERVYVAKVSQRTPIRWAILTGEIAHHLRSALDHLAWQLVLDAGGKPKTGAGGTEFPIFWDSNVYEAKGRRKVGGASELVVRYIDSVQPYQVDELFERHPLYIVHDLDIRDKHQLLNVVVGAFRGGTLTYTDPTENVDVRHFVIGSSESIRPVKDGTEIFRHPVEEAEAGVDMNGQFAFEITFEYGGSGKIEPLIPTLDMVVRWVDQLITLFRPLFQQTSS